jgi:hypothetical protein
MSVGVDFIELFFDLYENLYVCVYVYILIHHFSAYVPAIIPFSCFLKVLSKLLLVIKMGTFWE